MYNFIVDNIGFIPDEFKIIVLFIMFIIWFSIFKLLTIPLDIIKSLFNGWFK